MVHDARLGDLRDLADGQTRSFPHLGDHGVVICRVAGQLYAVADNCSHRDAKLSEGRLRGSLLTCPLHGAQFDVRTGAHQGPPASMPIACFGVTEVNGIAWLHVLSEVGNMPDPSGFPTVDVVATGSARAPGPTLREQLLADPTPPPWPLLEQSPLFLGDEDVPFTNYTSPEYAQAEYDHMWSKTWQWACHNDHIPESGDYYVYDVGPYSALIVRTADGAIRAYYNACMHRGTQLRSPGTCGFATQLRCPFHGWTWSLDGELIDLPDRWDFPHVGEESHRLPQLRVEVFAGFVWVNFDPDARPLAQYLGVLPAHFAEFDLEDRYIETHVRKRLPANWKAATEAFLEAYHVRETHASGQLGDEVTTQYDVFAPNISRFVHTTGLDSPQRPVPRTEHQILAHLTRNLRFGLEPLELPPGVRARDFYALYVQQEMGEKCGRDFTNLSESITLDSIEYFAFPNACFFPGLSLGMVYRFRPDPTSMDHSYFDLLMLRPRPLGGDAPSPPPVVELDVDDSYTLVDGLGGLGRVYDEDTVNMAAQTRGFRASRKRGQTLGNYQEVRARHLQQRVREFLSGGGFET